MWILVLLAPERFWLISIILCVKISEGEEYSSHRRYDALQKTMKNAVSK